jgi:hypothetical protein
MKIVSFLFLIVISAVTLTACDSGKGPSKPAAAASVQISN